MQLTDKRDLGIHTERIGDGILSLVESGTVTQPPQELPAGLDLRARLAKAVSLHASQPGA
jgi:acyl-CoA hydrolase